MSTVTAGGVGGRMSRGCQGGVNLRGCQGGIKCKRSRGSAKNAWDDNNNENKGRPLERI